MLSTACTQSYMEFTLTHTFTHRHTLVILPLACLCGRPDYTRCHWSCSRIRLCPTLSCSPIHCCSLMLHYRRKEGKEERKEKTYILIYIRNILVCYVLVCQISHPTVGKSTQNFFQNPQNHQL